MSPCVAGKPSPITSSWAPSGALFWPKNQMVRRPSPGALQAWAVLPWLPWPQEGLTLTLSVPRWLRLILTMDF